MFQNPIQQQQGATAPVVQQAPQSSAVGDLANLATAGLQMWQSAQPQPPSASEIKEIRQTEGSQVAVSRLREFHHLREAKGEDHARRWLNRSVLQDQGGMTESSRSAYMSVIRSQAGSQLAEEDLQHETKLRHAAIEERNELIQDGRLASGNPNLSEDDAYLVGLHRAIKMQEVEDRQAIATLRNAEATYEANERTRATQLAAEEWMADQSASALGEILNLNELEDSEREEAAFQLEQRIERAIARLDTNLGQVVRQVGGSLSSVDRDTITAFRNELEFHLAYLNGTSATERLDRENEYIMARTLSEVVAQEKGSRFFASAVFSRSVGMPIDAGLMTRVPQDHRDIFSDEKRLLRITGHGWEGLGSATISQQGTVEEASQAARALSTTVTDIATQIREGKEVGSFMRQQIDMGMDSIVNTLFESGRGKPSEKEVVNHNTVLPNILSQLASLPDSNMQEYAREAFERAGVDPQELFEDSFQSFARSSIIPSLRSFDPHFLPSVSATIQGGNIRLKFNQEKYNELRGPTGSTRSNLFDTRMSANMNYDRRLRKVEQHLSHWGQAYERLLGLDKEVFLESMVGQFTVLGGLYSEE